MTICGLKFDLLILQLTAVFTISAALIDPYARNHYGNQGSYIPRGSYQYEAEEPSTTEASKTFKIEVDVPQLLRSYLGLPETQARSDGEPVNSNKFQLELKTPDLGQMWESFKGILRESTTSTDYRHNMSPHAYVEEAPGTFKSETVVYPKDFHQANLLKLLKLKEKMKSTKKGQPKKSRRFWGVEHEKLLFPFPL